MTSTKDNKQEHKQIKENKQLINSIQCGRHRGIDQEMTYVIAAYLSKALLNNHVSQERQRSK